jgi:uncharacterized cupin superfamily protein
MKKLIFEDLYCWSIFSELRQIDFNGHLWVRPEGNVLIDPVPMSEPDLVQFEELGGAAWVVVTNQDHEREAAFFRQRNGAEVVAHAEDAGALSVPVDRPVADGDEIVPGLRAIHLRHGKSAGEIALYWPDKKAVLCGDLVVGAPMGRFTLLMDEKLEDAPRAALQLRKLLKLDFDALLVGDGHSIFQDARQRLVECLEERRDIYINRINAEEVEWAPWSGAEGYAWETRNIDPLIGARHLGYRIIRLPAARSTFPLHFHHFDEEMFYVMEGTCTLISPRGEVPVSAGDFIAFPPGPRSAHKFVNQGTAPCTLLALGTALESDVCEYPDSDKVNVRGLPRRTVFRKKDAVDYWEGE